MSAFTAISEQQDRGDGDPAAPRAVHMRMIDQHEEHAAMTGNNVLHTTTRVSFSSSTSSSSPLGSHRARLAASADKKNGESAHTHAHHGASSFSLSAGTRTRSSTEDSPLVRPRFHSESEEINENHAQVNSLQLLSSVTRSGSNRHAVVTATNPAADVPAAAAVNTPSSSPLSAAAALPHSRSLDSFDGNNSHSKRVDSHSVSSNTQQPPAFRAESPDESKEQIEANLSSGTGLAASPSPSSASSLNPSSPKKLPLHFHSKLPTSAHNPLVMLDKFRSSSGAAIIGLDEDEIKLEDAAAAAATVDGQPLSPRSLAELPESVTLHLPIPIGPPTAHFTQSSWSWKQIDYIESHVPLLTDFFTALETHSEAFVDRLDRLNNPPPAAVVPPTFIASRRASLDKLPPLPPVRSPAKEAAAAAAAAAASSVAASPLLRPASASSLLASLTPLAAASSSDGSSGSASPRPAPVYPANFVPHRIASLQMHARKELLRKTKVITSVENGPGFIERNPSEQLLANLFATSGTIPTSASSSGAHTARGHSSAYYSSNAAAASAAASLLSSTSAASSLLPPPSGLNAIPHLASLDFRMGVSGEVLAESLKRNQTLTQIGLSHNVISEKGCTALCRNLQSHPQLRIMDLSHNILYPEAAPALRDLLLYNRTLSSLDLAINKLGCVGVSTVLEALGASKPNMRAIKTFVERSLAPVSVLKDSIASSPQPSVPSSGRPGSSPLSFNSAGSASSSNAPSAGSPVPVGSPPQASFVPGGSSNASPNPVAASVSSSGAGAAALSSSGSSAPSLLQLMPAFSINQSLTSLNLANNKLGTEIDSVASALTCNNSALKELNLSLNDIGDSGAHYLALALRHPNCGLRILNIADNLIGPMGTKILMQALEHNSGLQRLDLSWNTLGQSGLGEGPRAVGRMLACNSTLKELVLQSNYISDGGLKAICTAWMENLERQAAAAAADGSAAAPSGGASALQLLDLSVNPLGDWGMRELSSILGHAHCPLHTLLINRCQLSDDGCASLISVLPVSPQLLRLSLQGNAAMKPSTCAQLIDTYSKSKRLIECDVEDSPHITRDDALAALYRRARTDTFARLVTSGSGLPHELTKIVAEYILDLRHKSASSAASGAAGAKAED